MFTKTTLAVVALAAASSPVFAQGFTGGQLGIEYSAPTEGGDFGGTTYSGGAEYAITRDFSVAGDLSGYRLDNINTDASSATLHGIYHLNDSASVGAFYGQDMVDSGNATLYGIEGGTEFSGANVEGYIGMVDGTSSDATIFGADASYAIGNGFHAIGNLGVAQADSGDISQFSIGAEYDMAGGPEFYAELGRASVESGGVSVDQTFVGVGARIAFGAARGTTFNQRSLFEIIPGF